MGYYASNLRQLKEAIKSKRRGKQRAGVLLIQGKAPVHTTQLTVAETERFGFDLLPHASYSPDSAQSDFYLFPNLISYLRDRRFESDTMTSYVLLKAILGLRLQTSSNDLFLMMYS